MISKAPKDLYQKVCENLLNNHEIDLPQEEVSEFGKFFFNKLNNMISSLEHLEIYVPKLAAFRFRRMRGEKHYNKLQEDNFRKVIQNRPPEIIEKAMKTMNARKERLKVLLDRHDEMLNEKRDFKQKIDELESTKTGIQQPQ